MGGGVSTPRSSRSELSNNGPLARERAAVGPGAGIEPALTGSESVVLPTRRSRNECSRGRHGNRTHLYRLKRPLRHLDANLPPGERGARATRSGSVNPLRAFRRSSSVWAGGIEPPQPSASGLQPLELPSARHPRCPARRRAGPASRGRATGPYRRSETTKAASVTPRRPPGFRTVVRLAVAAPRRCAMISRRIE
jgi:hypothetical protein